MAKIHVFQSDSMPFVEAKPLPDAADQESEGSSRVHHPGGEDSPQLFEVIVRPNHRVDIHAHRDDEIIYVVAGEMRVGTHVLHAGDSVQIAGMTLYGFDTGPEGVRFLNFRGRQDLTMFSKSEFHEFKKLDPAGQAEMVERLVKTRMEAVGWD